MHKCLKIAAGQFKFVQENLTNKLIKSDSNKSLPFADTDDLILSTYINQCKAEAQESKLENSSSKTIVLKSPNCSINIKSLLPEPSS